MKNVKDRNWYITLLKLLFVILIVVMHCGIPFNNSYMFEGAYVFVDFFFILQGFYLIKDSENNPYDEASTYFISKLKRYFPIVLFFSIIVFLLQINTIKTTTNLIDLILNFISQVSFGVMQFAWLYNGTGAILWFLSASIIMGTFLLFIYKTYKEKFIILAPFISAGIYNYLFKINGNLDIWNATTNNGVFCIGLIRSMADIIFGILVMLIYRKIKDVKINELLKNILRVVLLILPILLIVLSIYVPHSKLDFYLIFVFGFILIFSSIVFKTKKSYVIAKLDNLTMPIYLMQTPALLISKMLTNNPLLMLGCTIVLDILFSYIYLFADKKIRRA